MTLENLNNIHSLGVIAAIILVYEEIEPNTRIYPLLILFSSLIYFAKLFTWVSLACLMFCVFGEGKIIGDIGWGLITTALFLVLATEIYFPAKAKISSKKCGEEYLDTWFSEFSKP